MSNKQNEEIHPEKLVIIGVAGPVGSGCTTVARFLTDEIYEDEEGLDSYLKRNEFLNAEGINYDKYEKDVELLYRRRLRVDSQLGTITPDLEKSDNQVDVKKLEEIKSKAEKLHAELKETLEKREVIESLDYLTDQEDYNKQSRYYISVSDIIIFKCLVDFQTESTPREDRKRDIERMRQIIANNLEASNLSYGDFSELYQAIISFYRHEEKSEAPSFEKFKECIEQVRKIKREIVKLDSYRDIMQDFGDNIRCSGKPFLYIGSYPDESERKKLIGENKYSLAKDLDYIIHYLMNEHHYFIVVDCFRNPNTAKYFRDKHSKFCLLSLYCDRGDRLKRLVAKESRRKNNSFDQRSFVNKFKEYDARDEGEKLSLEEKLYKQNVKDTALISDIAINNEGTKEALFSKLIRYIGLILDPGCTKPTSDEMFMNLAYTMAMKSNCISRQVGAVIEGEKGYVVGAGWNDVGEGQISCGLRNIRDLSLPAFQGYITTLDPEDSDAKRIVEELKEKLGRGYFCFCFKDEMSINETKRKIEQIGKNFLRKRSRDLEKNEKKSLDDFVIVLKKNLDVKRLEYCKALHAEENAIIQGAKIGGMGIKGGTMYVTTFPCELCAKKIYQSGIKKIVYTEPYPGTISKEIYLEDGVSKVRSRQFEGVKPYGYFQLFKPFHDQKEWQELNKLGLVD